MQKFFHFPIKCRLVFERVKFDGMLDLTKNDIDITKKHYKFKYFSYLIN